MLHGAIDMKFYVAGYYGIQGSLKQSWMDTENLLPEKIWSGSSHICPKFPDAWIFDWVTDNSSEERKSAKMALNLSLDQFSAAQREFEQLFASDQFGFPNVFMNSIVAAEQLRKYFYNLPDLKLLGIAMPETYFKEFLDAYSGDESMYYRRNGVYKKIIQKEVCQSPAIGYDLLAWTGADYCSFLCNSLEDEIHQKHGVQYNDYGLVSTYEQAHRVSQAIGNLEINAEEGFWAPWLVFEIPIHQNLPN